MRASRQARGLFISISLFQQIRIAAFLALACGFSLFGGCASVTARQVESGPAKQMTSLPTHIYVKNYEIPAENLRVDRSGEKLAVFQKDLSKKLSTSLIKQLNRNLAPTTLLAEGEKPSRGNVWVIVGRFDRVEQGSRALRSAIGFGFGGTKVVATTSVYDLSTGRARLIMTIQTSGGSNATPGTVINLAPIAVMGPMGFVGVATGAIPGALPGLGADVKRSAREVTAVLSDYSHQRGLIVRKQVMHPKKPGGWALRILDPARPKSDDPRPDATP